MIPLITDVTKKGDVVNYEDMFPYKRLEILFQKLAIQKEIGYNESINETWGEIFENLAVVLQEENVSPELIRSINECLVS